MTAFRHTILKLMMLAICMPSAATHSSQGNELVVDLVKAAQPLWILPEKPTLVAQQPYMLRFALFSRAYAGNAKLEVLFEWPNGYHPGDVIYRVRGGDANWSVLDYAYRTDNRIEIFLPALETGERMEVAIGWVGAPFDESRAYALLTTDTEQVAQQWVGWKLK